MQKKKKKKMTRPTLFSFEGIISVNKKLDILCLQFLGISSLFHFSVQFLQFSSVCLTLWAGNLIPFKKIPSTGNPITNFSLLKHIAQYELSEKQDWKEKVKPYDFRINRVMKIRHILKTKWKVRVKQIYQSIDFLKLNDWQTEIT